MYVDMLQIVFFHPITFFMLGSSFRQNIFFSANNQCFHSFFSGLQNSALVFFAIENPFIFKEIECFLSTTILPFVYVFEIPQFIWSVR